MPPGRTPIQRDVVVAPPLSRATAVMLYEPAATPLQVKVYGDEASVARSVVPA